MAPIIGWFGSRCRSPTRIATPSTAGKPLRSRSRSTHPGVTHPVMPATSLKPHCRQPPRPTRSAVISIACSTSPANSIPPLPQSRAIPTPRLFTGVIIWSGSLTHTLVDLFLSGGRGVVPAVVSDGPSRPYSDHLRLADVIALCGQRMKSKRL
jgi:hypothetical protein